MARFGKNSYVSDHVILKGLSKKNLKVGIDKIPEDQYYLLKSKIFKDGGILNLLMLTQIIL